MTFCRRRGARVPGREGKSAIVLESHGKPGLKETRNITTEASMSLKTKKGTYYTKSKGTQNKLQSSAETRTSYNEFEFFDIFGHLAEGSGPKRRGWSKSSESGTARKYNNRGNETKKCLKGKDITFFNPSNHARFAR